MVGVHVQDRISRSREVIQQIREAIRGRNEVLWKIKETTRASSASRRFFQAV